MLSIWAVAWCGSWNFESGGTVDLSGLEAGSYLVERWSATQRTGLVRVLIQ
jgi:hypothetical protein